MILSGWGRHPRIDAQAQSFETRQELATLLADQNAGPVIVHALGRSYGDSSLAKRALLTRRLNCLLDFDPSTGLLSVESGVSLAEIIEHFLPRGWFLPVTPGTQFVTIGGAIASDVHGKNHHKDGSFSDHVTGFELMLPDGSVQRCSQSRNQDLFRATCGGMGLTGVIVSADIRLRPVRSAHIDQRTIRARNLREICEKFAEYEHQTYSVAWIDCLQTGEHLGRSILMAGEHAQTGGLDCSHKSLAEVPFSLPSWSLNSHTVSLFNFLYYNRLRSTQQDSRTNLFCFFYPLDAVGQWNRIYGAPGFTQYQFVLPLEAGHAGLRLILKDIAASGLGSFLAVLKLFGPGNANYLSFPRQGYTLALDFKIEPRLFPLLDRLDSIVLDHGGRLYLTKDVRMSPLMLERGYPLLDAFRRVRAKVDPEGRMGSLQSQRLGL